MKKLLIKFLNQLKKVIEFCGKHPFATGLFAIIGIAGLILSIRGFNLDREESKFTTKQVDSVSKQITNLDTKIELNKDTLITIASISSPAKISDARNTLTDYYGWMDLSIDNTLNLDFNQDGFNEGILISYHSNKTKNSFIDVFKNKSDGKALAINHKIDKLARSFDLSPIILNNKPYLAFWEFSGTLEVGIIVVYEFNNNNIYKKLWQSEPIFKGFAKVEEEKLIVYSGQDKYALDSDNGIPFLKSIILNDSTDPLHNTTNDKIVNIKISRPDDQNNPLNFYLNDNKLKIRKSSGKQTNYSVPWSHYSVYMTLPKGNLIRLIPDNDVAELFKVKTLSKYIEQKEGEKLTYLLKLKGYEHILYERRYEETYRLNIHITD